MTEKYKKRYMKWFKGNHEKFEKAGCGRCSNGQLYSGGGDACSVTYYNRCECANINTKRYTKFLIKEAKLQDKLSHTDFRTIERLWFDNNSNITEGNNTTDRSW